MLPLIECPKPFILPRGPAAPAVHHVQSAISGCPPGTVIRTSAILNRAASTAPDYSREAFKYPLIAEAHHMKCISQAGEFHGARQATRTVFAHPLNSMDETVCMECPYNQNNSSSCIIFFPALGMVPPE